MKQMRNEDLLETLEKRSTKAWQESISSRLESMRSYLSADEWEKGVGPFLRSVQGHSILRILNEKCDQDQVHFLRGFAAGLQLAISLPASVEAQISQEQNKAKGIGPGKDTFA